MSVHPADFIIVIRDRDDEVEVGVRYGGEEASGRMAKPPFYQPGLFRMGLLCDVARTGGAHPLDGAFRKVLGDLYPAFMELYAASPQVVTEAARHVHELDWFLRGCSISVQAMGELFDSIPCYAIYAAGRTFPRLCLCDSPADFTDRDRAGVACGVADAVRSMFPDADPGRILSYYIDVFSGGLVHHDIFAISSRSIVSLEKIHPHEYVQLAGVRCSLDGFVDESRLVAS